MKIVVRKRAGTVTCPYNLHEVCLDVTHVISVLHRVKSITLGTEFMSDVKFVSGICDGAHHGRVIDFLLVIEIVPSRIACGVVMTDVFACYHVPLLRIYLLGSQRSR